MTRYTESEVEEVALSWLQGLGYQVAYGPDLLPGGPSPERYDEQFRETILKDRLLSAMLRLNPEIPPDVLADAAKKLTRVDAASLLERNRGAHRLMIEGIEVEFRKDGRTVYEQVQVINFDDPDANDWLAVNQFTVAENKHIRRPDIVLFLNGLPIVVIELKNPGDEKATIWTAFSQLQTYQNQISSLFTHNVAMIASDGVEARLGVIGAGREWFKTWRTADGDVEASKALPQLKVMLEGAFEQRRFLNLMRHFVTFEQPKPGKIIKKLAGYHQFHAVNAAVEETLRAAKSSTGSADKHGGEPGDRRVGVVWHTQGSGKSLSMAFYAGRIILHPEMENPTIVVLTDRNDLDDQLFGTFAACQDLLRQEPVQAADRADLREKLNVGSGGVVFTTIQKFLPETKGDQHAVLSDRQNIVVIADEAHRSQYDFIDGFARHMRDALPKASFIGFTGTPIEKTDANTRAVFGSYISIYDIRQAVKDQATVPIYYESRLAKLGLDENLRPTIDPEFDEATEGEEVEHKERLKSKWAQLEALVGADTRKSLVAADLVKHWEIRLSAMSGKAMIVCMSRRICVELYEEIIKLKPEWAGTNEDDGRLKVVMTGSASDPLEWQKHIRSKKRREDLANRFRDPADPFQIVIVRDMWLTGFDAPSLHTMYLDKPMRGHGLMQAIARVNRVFKDKPGGLVVDYLGIADELKKALATYTESGGKGEEEVARQQEKAVWALREKYEVCRGMFHGFEWADWTEGTPADRLALLPAAQEHLLSQPDGKKRFIATVGQMSQAFALAVPHEDALALRDDIAFFQAVRSVLAKGEDGDGKRPEEMQHAIRQLVSKAIVSDEVVDVFTAAGLNKPDISILSDEFLAEVKGMPQKNLAVELLRKLLQGEIKTRSERNVVQGRSFAELLDKAVKKYQNRAIETAQVIEELIALAKEIREANERGAALGMTEDEIAFYDALETNDSAVKVLGDESLRTIARELVESVKNNVSIDWTHRETVRAKLRVIVKRILRKHGYPPDMQKKATDTVLEQAAALSNIWASQ